MADRDELLEDFLQRVEEIGNIISDLNSNEEGIREVGLKRADDYLSSEKIQFDGTVVNKGGEEKQQLLPRADAEEFLKEIAKDAEERGKRRAERTEASRLLRLRGNGLYGRGGFDAALECYTRALDLDKGNVVLYTNRAQTYLKLGKYKEAIGDCEAALMLSEQNFKAYLIKGQALLRTNHLDESLEVLLAAAAVDASKAGLVQVTVDEVMDAKETRKEEEKCKEFYRENGSKYEALMEKLKRLQEPSESALGFKEQILELIPLLKEDHAKVLFRMESVFNIIMDSQNCSILGNDAQSLSFCELEIISATFELFNVLCDKNVENQKILIQLENFPQKVMELLENLTTSTVERSILRLLDTISLEVKGRRCLSCMFENVRLLKILLTIITSNSTSTVISASIINNMALEKRFRQNLSASPDDFIGPLADCIQKLQAKRPSNTESLLILTALGNLSLECKLRETIGTIDGVWKSSLSILEEANKTPDLKAKHEFRWSMFGLFVNLCSSSHLNIAEIYAEELVQKLAPCINEVKYSERACNVLAHVIASSRAAFKRTQILHLDIQMLTILQDPNPNQVRRKKQAMQVLATLTKFSKKTQRLLIRNKGLSTLIELLNQSSDASTLGNAILCLTHCIEIPKVSSALTSTNIIEKLLAIIKSEEDKDLVKNAAILLGKLSKSDECHLARLRNLDGIRVLHSIMHNFN